MTDEQNAGTRRRARPAQAAPNPFTPVTYTQRFSRPLPKAEPNPYEPPMRPGQYYTGSWSRVPEEELTPVEGLSDLGEPTFGAPASPPSWSDAPNFDAPNVINAMSDASTRFYPPVLEPYEPMQVEPTREIPGYLRDAPRPRRRARAPESRVDEPAFEAAAPSEPTPPTQKLAASEPPMPEPREKRTRMQRRVDAEDVREDLPELSHAPAPENEPVPEPVFEPVPVPSFAPDGESASAPAFEPAFEPAPAPAFESVFEPISDPAPDAPDTLPPLDPYPFSLPSFDTDEQPLSSGLSGTFEPPESSPADPFSFGAHTFDFEPARSFGEAPSEGGAPDAPPQSFDPYARFAPTGGSEPLTPDAATGRDEVAAFFDDEPYAERDEPSAEPASAPTRPSADSAPAASAQASDARPKDGKSAAKPAAPVKPPKPPKRPIRWSRVLALVAIVGMIAFCGIVGGGILSDLAKNEREMDEFREDYIKQNGARPEDDGSRVELLPFGQTYVPTATPEPPPATATPTPRIAMNDPAIAALGGRDAGVVTEEPTDTPAPRTKRYDYPKNTLRNIVDSMQELHEEYPDAVGRLTINGVLDEVVVQRNNTFYLTHNYRGTSAKSGAVFVDESCQLKSPPENLLLRAQSAIEGKAFAPLWQYQSGGGAFVSSAAIASLTTLYEEERYVLFAVVVTGGDPSGADYFNYAGYPSFSTDEEMLAYVEKAVSLSLYRFNVSVVATDRLLTLATVGGEGGKTLVLMFRMLRDGEGHS